MIRASMNTVGLGALIGGNTLSPGKLAELGNTVATMPATKKGSSLGDAKRNAESFFAAELRSNKIRITTDERGLVISLTSDAFFNPASDQINLEESREILLQLAVFLSSNDLGNHKLRIEGHTDSTPTDPNGPWKSNWQLSTARSISVLSFLTDVGVVENRFQVAGFADTVPIANNNTPEGRAYNRRVDIIILDEGHL
jgi:chemotaxis protein MotB